MSPTAWHPLRWPHPLLPSPLVQRGARAGSRGLFFLHAGGIKGEGDGVGKNHIPGESAPGWCQGGVWTLSGLSGTDPIPGSCFISPLSICALRVLGGDSECFRFLAGCTGRLRRPAGQRRLSRKARGGEVTAPQPATRKELGSHMKTFMRGTSMNTFFMRGATGSFRTIITFCRQALPTLPVTAKLCTIPALSHVFAVLLSVPTAQLRATQKPFPTLRSSHSMV